MRSLVPTLCAGALGVLMLVPSVRADRAAIERTLGEMQRAALAADVDGYLSHVSRADANFYKEQENWAKDLRRRNPVGLELHIGEPSDGERQEFGAERARFELVIDWSIEPEKQTRKADGGETNAEGRRPIERSISYPVVFTLDKSGAEPRWLFAGEDWITLESGNGQGIKAGAAAPASIGSAGGAPAAKRADDAPASKSNGAKADARAEEEAPEPARPRDVRFQGPAPASDSGNSTLPPGEHRVVVRYFPGYEDVARRIAEVLPGVRDHVDEGFAGRVPRAQEVKLYPSMKHLQESIYLSYVDGLSGWNEPGEAIKLLVRPTTQKRSLTTLLAHEYGHVATFELGPKANDMPWWILEGVAELSAERFRGAGDGRDVDAAIARWSKKGDLASWDDLADFHKVQASSDPSLQGKVYRQGHHMVGYISDRFGRDGRNAWLRALSRGATLDEATREALKMPFAELDAQWRERVKEIAAKLDAEREQKEREGGGKGEPKKDKKD